MMQFVQAAGNKRNILFCVEDLQKNSVGVFVLAKIVVMIQCSVSVAFVKPKIHSGYLIRSYFRIVQ